MILKIIAGLVIGAGAGFSYSLILQKAGAAEHSPAILMSPPVWVLCLDCFLLLVQEFHIDADVV